jgi:hypothetical protein
LKVARGEMTFADGIAEAAAEAAAAKGLKNPNCFPAGTLVSVTNGRKPIECLSCGDQVWSFDFQVGMWRLCRVLETAQSAYDGATVVLTLGAEEIVATAGHPCWVVRGLRLADRGEPEDSFPNECNTIQEGRWVSAADLMVGDELLLHNGETLPLERVAAAQQRITVYNIRVEQLHNYAVGSCEILAHNGGPDSAGPARPTKPYADPTQRPAYGEDQVKKVWDAEAAKDPNGRVFDPHTGKELFWDPKKPRNGQWDMGHIQDQKYENLHKAYMEGRISLEEFLRRYRDPNNYRPEKPGSNRSRVFD